MSTQPFNTDEAGPRRRSFTLHAMRTLLLLVMLAAPLGAAETTVTLLHFSDYHSHALPFYDDAGERGGIARAIGFLQREKRKGALVFNGGDTMNKGAPAWSDEYECAEWPWMNGVVDAMAFGNHDADYGRTAYERCRSSVTYPILSANTEGFRPWSVFERKGVRVGVFAVAGPDFRELVTVPGFTFGDPIAAAREAVRILRDEQHADVVVLIGHEHAEPDYALARAVPGIDVVFGTHSHLEQPLTQIPGTSTVFISPGQYLTSIARVEITVADGHVKNVKGTLIPVDATMRPDRRIARKVARMQRALEKDPSYRELFVHVGHLPAPLSRSELAAVTLASARSAVDADVAASTMSSFRQPLPAGEITPELLRAALPYDNEIVVCTMTGAQIAGLVEDNARRTDSKAYFAMDGSPDPSRTYTVAATDYMANVAWRDLFTCDKKKTGLRIRAEFQKRLARH